MIKKRCSDVDHTISGKPSWPWIMLLSDWRERRWHNEMSYWIWYHSQSGKSIFSRWIGFEIFLAIVSNPTDRALFSFSLDDQDFLKHVQTCIACLHPRRNDDDDIEIDNDHLDIDDDADRLEEKKKCKLSLRLKGITFIVITLFTFRLGIFVEKPKLRLDRVGLQKVLAFFGRNLKSTWSYLTEAKGQSLLSEYEGRGGFASHWVVSWSGWNAVLKTWLMV